MLLPDFVHDAHDHQALVPAEDVTLAASVTYAARAFVCLVEHACARNVMILEIRSCAFFTAVVIVVVAATIRSCGGFGGRNKAISGGAVGGTVHLHFACGALDADRWQIWSCRVETDLCVYKSGWLTYEKRAW